MLSASLTLGLFSMSGFAIIYIAACRRTAASIISGVFPGSAGGTPFMSFFSPVEEL